MAHADFDSDKTPYSYIWAERNSQWTHVYVRVFNLAADDYAARDLVVDMSSQGTMQAYRQPGETRGLYAFDCGIGNFCGKITLPIAEAGVKLLRKMNRVTGGEPYLSEGFFARYALDRLKALKVKHHFVNQEFNRNFTSNITDLPCFTNDIDVYDELLKLEQEARNY